MIKLETIKSKYLTLKIINKICILKDSHWKFGMLSQKKWFKRNTKNSDMHNLLFYKEILIGYTSLKKRYFYENKIKNNYLLFDTLVINQKYRNFKMANILMDYNNFIIKKFNFCSFLLCDKELIKFYKKYQWKNVKGKIKIFPTNKKFRYKKILTYNVQPNRFDKKSLLINI